MWELGKALIHNDEELQSASRWRCFSYENQHHLLAKCYTSILCLKAFANSHTKISILAFPRLKVLLTYNFWLEIKNSCTILALFHKIQLWSSKRTLRYIGEIKSTITRLFQSASPSLILEFAETLLLNVLSNSVRVG